MGPIMFDVHGTSLTPEDKEILQHPLVGGLILFSRNYQSIQQVSALVSDIRKVANKDFLIAVDHEGGRVQRFREGFSKIPPMGAIWEYAGKNMTIALELAKHCGILMALEVQAIGIDISFAPILDVNGISDVIGDRSFHQDPEHIVELASAFIDGMHHVGMKATGKHFPGHGSVEADSHIALPIDNRSKLTVFNFDLIPFKKLIDANYLDALMPAHIIFPDVDSQAVGFSSKWLKDILRKSLGFDGVIFSDDLSMQGAAVVGGYIERAEAAQQAGCDMLLLCNNRKECINVIEHANIEINEQSSIRLKQLLNNRPISFESLKNNLNWQAATNQLNKFNSLA